MRNAIWNYFVRSKIAEGALLPRWAIALRAVLYPLDFIFWRMSRSRGYQSHNDTWLIEGVTYSGEALRSFAKAQGEVFRVARSGRVVILERVRGRDD